MQGVDLIQCSIAFNFNPKFNTNTNQKLQFSFQVNDLISNNQLNICSEEKVFSAVLNWVRHDLIERKHHISEVSWLLFFCCVHE